MGRDRRKHPKASCLSCVVIFVCNARDGFPKQARTVADGSETCFVRVGRVGVGVVLWRSARRSATSTVPLYPTRLWQSTIAFLLRCVQQYVCQAAQSASRGLCGRSITRNRSAVAVSVPASS